MYRTTNKLGSTPHHRIGQVAFVLVLLSSGWAGAQTQPPDRRGIGPADDRPELPPFETQEPTPQFQLPPVAPTPPGEIAGALRVFISDFEIVGNTVFSDEDLQEITAPFEGRENTSTDLETVRIALTRFYVDRGYSF